MSNVPKLRFPEFSGEWEEKELNKLTKIYDGTHSTPKYVEEGIPFYSVEHLTANQFKKTRYITEDIFEKENKRVKLEKNDILMTRIGDIGTSRLLDWDVKASFYVSLALIKQNKNFNSSFLNQAIKSINFQQQLYSKTLHVAFPKKINLGEIGQSKIYLPSKPEQEKIASFLSAVDTKIEQLTKKELLLQQYKKGVMQKLFSQELKFKDDNGKEFPEWEEKKIKDIFDITRGNVLSMTLVSQEKNEDNIYPVYSSQTKNNGLSGFFDKFLFEDCITWTTDGAGAGDVNYRKGKFYCTNVCGVLKSNQGYANQFVAELLNTVSRKYVSYVGNPKLMNNVMAEIKIFIPKSINEQTKIANLLSSIDKKIELISKEIEKAKEFKRGLLQQMFV